MKRTGLLLILLGPIMACSTLPQVFPMHGAALPEIQRNCRRPFADGRWQFLHSIEASLPGGHKALLMGVTIISSHAKTIRCVIMTIEGLVLLDVLYNRQLVINRAVAPFDSANLAEGLIQDIQLIFFEPAGPLIESGRLENESSVCRFRNPDGRIEDVVTHGDRGWEIRQYGPDRHLLRTVKGIEAKQGGAAGQPEIPSRVELTAHGSPGYALVMDLVEAVALDSK